MKNLGSFFQLARAQLDRHLGTESSDAVLEVLVPNRFHPTDISPVRYAVNRFVPPNLHMEAVAACYYFGGEQAAEVCLLFAEHVTRSEALEARARLVDNGQISAPTDAPCRKWPWRSVHQRLRGSREAALFRARLEPVFEDRTNLLVADVRDWLLDDWVNVTDWARRGFAWVVDDDGLMAGDEVCRLAIERILMEQAGHWPQMAPKWNTDSVIRWAEVCAKYVEGRRQ